MIEFIDPFTNSKLELFDDSLRKQNIPVFEKINGAYRILKSNENYTGNFGFQWNKFAKTQIDNQTQNQVLSKNRFFIQTQWDKEDLNNKNILEVGSGAGRFSQVVLKFTKANLYSVDYSNAVEANYKNNGEYGDKLKLFQASVYEMPFKPAQFDKVFCFGVLQHTPDVEKSVATLIEMAKPGGEIIVDFYPINGWWTKIHAKYLLRPITKKWSNEKLLNKIEKNVDWMISLSKFLQKIKLGFFRRFIPIVDIYGTLPQNLSPKELREWCVLDTFDMFSPQYDQPQKLSTVVNWFKKYNVQNVWGGFVDINGTKSVVVKGTK
jgi:ubiquinone/menaquinone biosynthesis C-methylase UbiE